MRRLPFIGLLLFLSVMVVIGNTRTETLSTPTVEFTQPLHFLTPGGEDVIVQQGTYEISQASEWLQLIPVGGDKIQAMLVEATPITHNETIGVPTALSVSDSEDEYVMRLLLPGGTGLESVGSYSGVRSKAVRRLITQGTQLQGQLNIPSQPAMTPTAPNLMSVKAYDMIDGQPSYQVSYRRDPAIQVNLTGPPPTHIRIGNNHQFDGAMWQTYRTDPVFRYFFPQKAGLGQKTIYVQAKVQSSASTAPLLSVVRTAGIELRQPPVIQNLTIAGSPGEPPGKTYGRDVVITWTRTGQANIARIGEQAQLTDLHAIGHTFSGGPTTSMAYQLSPGYGQKTIYVQLVDKPFAGNPSVYARSNVASVTIDVQPVSNQTITFENVQDVSTVIDFAIAQGYTFETWKAAGYEGECRLEKVDGVYGMVADLVYENSRGEPHGPGPSSFDVRSIRAVRPIACFFKLFAGKTLKAPWKLKLASIVTKGHPNSNIPSSKFFNPPVNCQGPRWQKPPTGNSTDPEIRVSVHSTYVKLDPLTKQNDLCLGGHYYYYGPTMIYHLRELKLEGPENQEWQQAFQP